VVGGKRCAEVRMYWCEVVVGQMLPIFTKSLNAYPKSGYGISKLMYKSFPTYTFELRL